MVSSIIFVFVGIIAGIEAFSFSFPSISDSFTSISDKVSGISDQVTGITDKVSGISDQFTGITDKVKDISDKVSDLPNSLNLPPLSGLDLASLAPKCEYSDNIATCCAGLSDQVEAQLCTKFIINFNQMNIKASFSFNNKILFERNVEVGKICVPTHVPMITACLHFYWAEIIIENGPQDIKSNICFQGSVSSLASVDFQCLRYENGRFSTNAEHQPSSKGWLNYELGK